MKKQLMIALLSIAPALGVVAQDKLYKDEFPLGDITLLDGPLKHARDLNVQVLLKYDCDRMLAPYRKEAGLQPRKPSYPNWDGLDGHVGGHYLSALAINAATGNGIYLDVTWSQFLCQCFGKRIDTTFAG